MMENLAVRTWIWILDLPARQKALDLLAKCAVSQRPHLFLSEFGVYGQLRQHPDHAVRDRLALGIGGSLEDVQNRVHGHAICGIEHERTTLSCVAAHLDQSSQRVGLQRTNQPGCPTSQGG